MFEKILGNEAVKGYLSQMIERDTIAQSLLFAGPEGVGKSLFAEALAAQLGCPHGHPDLHIYRPEGKLGMHSMQSLRQFCEDVYMAPFQGGWKVFIIHDAERMLPTSANALLKTFEEPPKKSLIILLSSSPTMLLTTILSRCRKIYFQALAVPEIQEYLVKNLQLDEVEAQRIAELSAGSLSTAIRYVQQGGDEGRKELLDLLARGKMGSYSDLTDAASAIASRVEESKKQLEEEVKTLFYSGGDANFTAVQKEIMQKEVDGALAMRLNRQAQTLFENILGWYRDLQLIRVNGDRRYLIHPDYENELVATAQAGPILEFEIVQAAVKDAETSLQRSTGLESTLETLFLKLNLMRIS